MLTSELCTVTRLRSPEFLAWADLLRPAWGADSTEPVMLHRKLWEWIFIARALEERGLLEPGRRGLGFGVGQEPLAAVFAARGCEIVATDLGFDTAERDGWVSTEQHASTADQLNVHGLCPPEVFRSRVQFRVVDMNAVPADLTDFDFCWSSCAFEHLGTLDAGLRFVEASLATLRPKGVAVHTTEFNVSSDDVTVEAGGTVLYRRRDVEQLADHLLREGHGLRLDLRTGDAPEDDHVDAPPFGPVHLKVSLASFVVTSLGLIVVRHARGRLLGGLHTFARRARRKLRSTTRRPRSH